MQSCSDSRKDTSSGFTHKSKNINPYSTAWMGSFDAWVVGWVAMYFCHSCLSFSKEINTMCRVSSLFGTASKEMMDTTMRTIGQTQWTVGVSSGAKRQDPRRRAFCTSLIRQSTTDTPLRCKRGIRLGRNFPGINDDFYDLPSHSNWN